MKARVTFQDGCIGLGSLLLKLKNITNHRIHVNANTVLFEGDLDLTALEIWQGESPLKAKTDIPNKTLRRSEIELLAGGETVAILNLSNWYDFDLTRPYRIKYAANHPTGLIESDWHEFPAQLKQTV
jgi:hypothetical protein